MSSGLEDIDGVGPGTREKLESYGISSMSDLARADSEAIGESDIGISAGRAETLIGRAQQQAIVIQSGDEVREEYESRGIIPTGISHLDTAIAGGFQNQQIVAVGGDTGSGKTQIAFQMLGNAVQETGQRAVYLETEPDRYQGRRIIDMFDKQTQSKVDKISVRGDGALSQQKRAYDAIRERYDELSMIVVDSFTSRFRLSEEFDGRGSLSERSTEFKNHLSLIESMAIEHNCPVLLICQVYQDPDPYSGQDYVIYGSTLMMHMVGFVMKLNNRGGALSSLKVENHPNNGDSELDIQIVESGVQEPE